MKHEKGKLYTVFLPNGGDYRNLMDEVISINYDNRPKIIVNVAAGSVVLFLEEGHVPEFFQGIYKVIFGDLVGWLHGVELRELPNET